MAKSFYGVLKSGQSVPFWHSLFTAAFRQKLFFADKAVKNFHHCIDNSLTQRVCRFADLFVVAFASREREIRPLIRNNSFGSLDRPLGKIAAAADGHFVIVLIYHCRCFLQRHSGYLFAIAVFYNTAGTTSRGPFLA
ncbi:hypothetical protein [Rhizobium lemnae]|uniref:hypothetical protein n=1 Tax=Rhizobium lemnae TaxID=1214924 RepID=UPI0036706FB1